MGPKLRPLSVCYQIRTLSQKAEGHVVIEYICFLCFIYVYLFSRLLVVCVLFTTFAQLASRRQCATAAQRNRSLKLIPNSLEPISLLRMDDHDVLVVNVTTAAVWKQTLLPSFDLFDSVAV